MNFMSIYDHFSIICLFTHLKKLKENFAVKYSTVKYSRVDYSTVKYSRVEYSIVKYSRVECSRVEYSTVEYSIVEYSRQSTEQL